MKKKAIGLAAMTAALILGTASTSFAAGWAMEDGSWVYEDSDGSLVTNEWRRGADNQWRYLDGYGRMAVNSWVDEEYYVDANGIMVSGTWLQLDSAIDGDTEGTDWYYFQENGKALVDTWKKLNNKWYHFGENGSMEIGWIDDGMYYCGDDGAALIGWHLLDPPEGEDDSWEPFDDNEGKKWYYFNTSGKKYAPADDSASDYVEKRIDGVYYCFDRSGAMQTGWVELETEDKAYEIEKYRYYGEDGKSITGWYSAYPPETIADSYDSEVEWFYFSKNGVPKAGPKSGEATVKDLISINNKTYLFNDKGNPVQGLQRVWISDSESSAYYFDVRTRTVVKGRQEIEESNGEKSVYYFGGNGRGYTGVYSGSLYYMGKLQKAEEGSRYELIEVGGKTYVVNTGGKVVRNSSGVRDAYGTKYATNSSGILTKIDDQEVTGSGYGDDPTEPIW